MKVPHLSPSEIDDRLAAGMVRVLYGKLLNTIDGEDSDREGLKETPRRAAEAFQFLTQGYKEDIDSIVGNALFDENYDSMVIVRDIEFYSLCEHHLLPFFGKCHIGYISSGKIIGLSKIPRIVDAFARRLQVQERLTERIAGELNRILEPEGVGVIIEGYHMCMMMRGVQKQNAVTQTNVMTGSFKDDVNARQEFLSALGGK